MVKDLYKEGCTQNREISWLRFDDRVLNEAKDPDVPLLERIKFVSIYGSNLEEFFMVRAGSLYDMEKVKFNAIDNKSGLTAEGQLQAIYPMAKRGCRKRDKIFRELREEMAEHDIYDIENVEDCKKKEIKYLKKYFRTRIEPLLTPQIVDTHHPFPNLQTGVTYVACALKMKKHGVFGFVNVPTALNDIVVLPDEDHLRFVHLEDVVSYFVDTLFPDADMEERVKMKINRSAYVDADDDAFDDIQDYRQKMMKVLRERRKMNVTRLVFSHKPSSRIAKYLMRHLNATQQMLFVSDAPFSMRYAFSLNKLVNEEQRKEFFYPEYEPKMTPVLHYKQKLFAQIQKKDVLLSYPYDSMTPFINLVKEAANDPHVVSIKITIYRLASHARLVEYLCQAAENGKQVDVLIELKARFDEQNNIDYSEKLEDAGCNVFYGFEHYKVHSKICLITKHDKGTTSHAAVLATGNFNENTAKMYTDLAVLTADPAIIEDCINFFRNMTIGKLDGTYNALLVAPVSLKSTILSLIEREASKGKDGNIFIKINGLTDEDIMAAMVRASEAGVTINMVIRGISCLLPQVNGKTENIHIRSIVGRYLEHSRIYIFGSGEDEKVYISSADLMTRNTERRVEIACPILDDDIKKQIHAYVTLCMTDNVKARNLGANGRYYKVKNGEDKISCQDEMMKNAVGSPDPGHSRKGTRTAVVFDTEMKLKNNHSADKKEE